MTFLQPFILWGLPLVLVPVVIHLLNRMRYRSVSWAAMSFLLASSRQSRRHARLRELLILLCRVLAVAALVLFVARPLVGGWLGWAVHSAPDTVLLLLDRSPSMETRHGEGELSCRAVAVDRLTAAARPLAGQSRLVLLDSATRQPIEIANPGLLGDLPQTEPTDASAAIPDLLEAAVDYITANQCGRTELWLATDLQAVDWEPDNAARWAEVAARLESLPQAPVLRLLALRAGGGADDLAVSVSEARRQPAVDHAELALTIDIARRGTTPIEVPVSIVIEGTRSQVPVRLDGRELRLRHQVDLGSRAARGWGWVELPADANPLNNRSYFVFPGARHLAAVVVAADAKAGRVLALAAAPAPDKLDQSAALLTPIDWPGARLDATALVIWQGPGEDQLRPFVTEGGVALWFPAAEAGEAAPDDAPLAIATWRGNEGPLAAADDGEPLPVRDVVVRRRVALTAGEHGAVLAGFGDGQPFLVRETVGKGALYRCATLPQREWSTLAEGSVLVPLVQRLLREGGQRLEAVGAETCGAAPLRDARRLDAPRAAVGWEAGVFARGPEWVARNRPASEDGVERLEVETVRSLLGRVPVRVFEDERREARLSAEVWRAFVWIMLLLLVAEAWLTLLGSPVPARAPIAAATVTEVRS